MFTNVQTVIAQVRAKADSIEAVKRACLALVAPSRAEKGCFNYDLYRASDDPALFVFYENWESLQDIDRHLQTPHALAFDEETAGLLAEEETITYLRKIG